MRSLTATAITLLFLNCCLWADVGGRITGVVKDPTQAAIPGATVVVTNSATGTKQTTRTDQQGAYSFPALAAGQYEIEVSAPGFALSRLKGLTIHINSVLQEDITLQVAAQSESLTVTTETEQIHIEQADTETGQTLTAQKITEVPLNGRSYTDLLAIQTGVTPATTSATSSTSSGGGFGAIAPSGGLDPGAFSVNGQRESANGFILNGANVEESIAENAAVVPNLDSIAEFRVLTSNFDAEHGGYSGGLVSVVTKTGTNQWHGSAFEFLRNTALDARGFFDPTRAPFKQNQFGGTLGGPIKKDKAFFFVDYQGTRNNQGIETGLLPVPSLANRSGNLSDQAASLTGAVNGSFLANLLAQKLGYAVTPGEPFFSSGCTSTSQCVFPNFIIPQQAISTPAQHLLQFIPLPMLGATNFRPPHCRNC